MGLMRRMKVGDFETEVVRFGPRYSAAARGELSPLLFPRNTITDSLALYFRTSLQADSSVEDRGSDSRSSLMFLSYNAPAL